MPEGRNSLDDKYIEHLLTEGAKSQESFDKSVFLLSGGALGVSLTFISSVVSLDQAGWKWFLFIAWACWCGSLTASLYSHQNSARLINARLNNIFSPPAAGDEKAVKRATAIEDRFERQVWRLNFLAGWLFIAGMVSMLAFVAPNLLQPGATHGRQPVPTSSRDAFTATSAGTTAVATPGVPTSDIAQP